MNRGPIASRLPVTLTRALFGLVAAIWAVVAVLLVGGVVEMGPISGGAAAVIAALMLANAAFAHASRSGALRVVVKP